MSQIAGRRPDHNGQVAHLLTQPLGWSIWQVLNHDIKVKRALVSEALRDQSVLISQNLSKGVPICLTMAVTDDTILPPIEHNTHPFTTISWKQSFVSQPSCIIFDWSCHPRILKPDPVSPSCPRMLNLQGRCRGEVQPLQSYRA